MNDEELERLLKEEFPQFSCICELCDCGRHKHHKNCTKRNLVKKKRTGQCPLTTNQETYKAHVARPRSSKRPPPTPRILNPPAMHLKTNQRDDFVNPGVQERVRPFILADNYEVPNVPIDFKTYYQAEFPPKENRPEAYARPMSQNRYLRKNSAKFDARTTNKESFKNWVPQPSLKFGELPSFTGSILYPHPKERLPNSTTQQSFPGAYAPKMPGIDMGPGNIRLEGKMDLLTTNMDTYRGKQGARAEMVVQQPQVTIKKRTKFQGMTQNMRDFAGFDKQPRRSDMAVPAPETIQLNFDNKQSFDTEQRLRFQGHDALANPVPKPYRTDPEVYVPPTEKFETNTVQKLTFTPKDLNEAYQAKVRIQPTKMAEEKPRFEGMTTYKALHKNWGAKPRVRYGDFHEGHKYMPPKDKFDGNSTTLATFLPKVAEPVHTYRPEETEYNKQGKLDFTTVNSETYKGHPIQICRAQAYILQQQLKQERSRKAQNPNLTPRQEVV